MIEASSIDYRAGPEMHIALVGPASPNQLTAILPRTDFIPTGYGGTPVTELCKALVEAGHKVTLATVDPSLEKPWSIESSSLSVICVPYRSSARARAKDFFALERKQLVSFLRDVKADVMHAHWTYEFALSALAVRHDSLVTAHDAPVTVLRQYRDPYRAVRLAMAVNTRIRTTNLGAVSPYLIERWRKEMRWRRPVSLLPNIAPRLVADHRNDAVQHRPNLLVLANADPRKNVRLLLETWPLIRRELPEYELNLAGPGLGVTDKLAEWAQSAGLSADVSFLGQLSRGEVGSALHRASILVHPSLEECHPMAIIEAMRAGVPVVGGRSAGGVPWTLDFGRAGTLCDVRDAQDLARAVVNVATDREGTAQRVASAVDRVEALYSERSAVAAHVETYNRIAVGLTGAAGA